MKSNSANKAIFQVKIENKLLVAKIKELNSQLDNYVNDYNFMFSNQVSYPKSQVRIALHPSLFELR